MKQPLYKRKEIPFFYDKSEDEFTKDRYERYDPMVIRQSALHLIDEVWQEYPLQDILNFGDEHWPKEEVKNVAEIGCSVGRWIAEIAKQNNDSNCWGIDYSYQLLRQAHDIWVKCKVDNFDLSRIGFSGNFRVQKQPVQNLNFGLAKAEELPFEDNSQDVILSSFLFDRLDEPEKGLLEMQRVLKQGGTMIMVTPLNFLKTEHWNSFHPPIKLYHYLINQGFNILDWKEDLIIKEPLDVRENTIRWNSIAVACKKK